MRLSTIRGNLRCSLRFGDDHAATALMREVAAIAGATPAWDRGVHSSVPECSPRQGR